MAYGDYLSNISLRTSAAIDEIFGGYNFTYGIEFEIALCHLLRKLLPDKYGICRGFIITQDNKKEGDDIIIYDRYRFPTLRVLGENSFERHECIPIEAVYAYVEAKHSLVLSGKGNTFNAAFDQIKKMRALTREPVTIQNSCDPYIHNKNIEMKSGRENWPNILNPLFCGIISREVRLNKKSKPMTNPEDIFNEMKKAHRERDENEPKPDLVIAGTKNIMLPTVAITTAEEKFLQINSPFYVGGKTTFGHMVAQDNADAFAIGLGSLLYALDTIRLGCLPWPKIISDGLDIRP